MSAKQSCLPINWRLWAMIYHRERRNKLEVNLPNCRYCLISDLGIIVRRRNGGERKSLTRRNRTFIGDQRLFCVKSWANISIRLSKESFSPSPASSLEKRFVKLQSCQAVIEELADISQRDSSLSLLTDHFCRRRLGSRKKLCKLSCCLLYPVHSSSQLFMLHNKELIISL